MWAYRNKLEAHGLVIELSFVTDVGQEGLEALRGLCERHGGLLTGQVNLHHDLSLVGGL